MIALLKSLCLAALAIRGPFPILSTPYFDDGSVDYESLARETQFVAKWCPGVIWGQSNDSVDLITWDERMKAFDVCAKSCEGLDVVSVQGLTANSDNLHFNTESLRCLGVRYAHAMCELEKSRQGGMG